MANVNKALDIVESLWSGSEMYYTHPHVFADNTLLSMYKRVHCGQRMDFPQCKVCKEHRFEMQYDGLLMLSDPSDLDMENSDDFDEVRIGDKIGKIKDAKGQKPDERNPLQNPPSFMSLPSLVHDMIIRLSDVHNKKNLRLTCTHFNTQVNRFVKFVPALSDETADLIANRTFKCTAMQVCDLVLPHSLTPLMSINFSDIQKLVFISHLCGHDFISKHNFFRLLRHCNMLTYLEIVGNVLPAFQVVDKNFYKWIHLNNLHTLKLEIGGSGDRYMAVEALQHAKFPMLKDFILLIMPGNQTKLRSSEYNSITRMMINHHATLRQVHIYDYGCVPNRLNFHTHFNPLLVEPTKGFEKIKLTCLEIVDAYDHPRERIPLQWNDFPAILEEQNHLKRLQLVLPSQHLLPFIYKAAAQCRRTLETFFHMNNIGIYTYQVDYVALRKFNCALVHQCTLLKQLRVHSSFLVQNFYLLPHSLQEIFWDAPMSLDQLIHLGMNMRNLEVINLGMAAGIIDTEFISRALRIPSLKILVIAHCNKHQVEALLDNFTGVFAFGWPYSTMLGVRLIIDRNWFDYIPPNEDQYAPLAVLGELPDNNP